MFFPELEFRLLFFIAIAVTITVAIAVTVAIVAYRSAVQNQRHVVQLLAAVKLFQIGEHATVEPADTDDEDGQIGNAVGNGCIGNDSYRHIVDYDVIGVSRFSLNKSSAGLGAAGPADMMSRLGATSLGLTISSMVAFPAR